MAKREWKRENVWLRMLLMAPTGGGKTLAALAVAATLFDGNLPIVAIDTEYERMKLYADMVGIADYRVIEDDFSPESYIAEIDEVEREFPGAILLIDSVTHEWSGTNGVLSIVDGKGGGNWKEGTPRHNKFVDRLMKVQMHLIVCCRSKMKYEYSTNDQGKRKQEKIGIGPEQRDNFLYNFDVVGDIDADTHLTTFTNRCRPLVDKTFNLVPDLDDLRAPNQVAVTITDWLSEGEPPVAPDAAAEEDVENLRGLLIEDGLDAETIERGFASAKRANRGVLPPEWVAEKTSAAVKRIGTKGNAAPAEPSADPEVAPIAETPPEDAVMASPVLGAAD